MNRGRDIPLGHMDEAVSRFDTLRGQYIEGTPPPQDVPDIDTQLEAFKKKLAQISRKRDRTQSDPRSSVVTASSKVVKAVAGAAVGLSGVTSPLLMATGVAVFEYVPERLNEVIQENLDEDGKNALKIIDSEKCWEISQRLAKLRNAEPSEHDWQDIHDQMYEALGADSDAKPYFELNFKRYRGESKKSITRPEPPQASTPALESKKKRALRNYSQSTEDKAKFIKEKITGVASDLPPEKQAKMEEDPYLKELAAQMKRKEAVEKDAERQRAVQQDLANLATAGSAVAMLGAVTKDPMLQKAGTAVNVGAGIMQNMVLLAAGGLAAGPVLGVAMGAMSLFQLMDDSTGPSESEVIKGYIDALQEDINKKHKEITGKLGGIERKVDAIEDHLQQVDKKLLTLQSTLNQGFSRLEESVALSTETMLAAVSDSERVLQASMAQNTERLYQDIMQATTTIVDEVRRQHDQTRLEMTDRFDTLESQLRLTHFAMNQNFSRLHLEPIKAMYYSAVKSRSLSQEQFATLFAQTGSLLYWADDKAEDPLFTGAWLASETPGVVSIIDEAASVRAIIEEKTPLQLLGFIQSDLAQRHARHRQPDREHKCKDLKIVNLDMWLMASQAYLEGRVKGMDYQNQAVVEKIRKDEVPKMIKGAEDTLRFIKHVQSEGSLMVLTDYFSALDSIQSYLAEQSRAAIPLTPEQLLSERSEFKALLNALDRTQLMAELYLDIANLNRNFCTALSQNEQEKASRYFTQCRQYALPKGASDNTGRYHRIFLKDQVQSQYWQRQALSGLITSKEIKSLIECTKSLAPQEFYDVITTQLQEGRHSHALVSRRSESFTRVYPYPLDESTPYRLTLRGQAELYAQVLEQAIFSKQFNAHPLLSEVNLAAGLLKELPDYLAARFKEQEKPEEKALSQYWPVLLPLVSLSIWQWYRYQASPPASRPSPPPSAHTQIRLLHTAAVPVYSRVARRNFSTTSLAFSNPALLNARGLANLGRAVLKNIRP